MNLYVMVINLTSLSQVNKIILQVNSFCAKIDFLPWVLHLIGRPNALNYYTRSKIDVYEYL